MTAKPKRLGDLLNLKRGYDLTESQRVCGDYPVISSAGISGYHNEYKVDGVGVVIGRYGTLGEAHFIEGKYWPHNTSLYVTDFKGNSPKYVYYLLTCIGRIRTSDKSAVPGVNRNELHEMAVPTIEDRTQQDLIAQVLSSFDAKIKLNHQINQEIEELAKLLYDYWFVQFDFPISSEQAVAMGEPKLEGKPYRQSGGKMTYDPILKREIPAGWKVTTLAKFANITMGQSPPGSSYNQAGNGRVFFQGSTDFGWLYPEIREYTTSPSRLAKEGDILLSVRAPVGTINIADRDCCIGRGLAALNAKDGHDSYLYEVLLYFKMVFDRRNASGTTFGAITKDDLHNLEFACPPKDSPLLDKFEQRAAPWRKLMLVNHRQKLELESLRDWLLPMLMNGQVTVQVPTK
jgi:type I restriction enzyme S subunit